MREIRTLRAMWLIQGLGKVEPLKPASLSWQSYQPWCVYPSRPFLADMILDMPS
jgi:hypothetical protein